VRDVFPEDEAESLGAITVEPHDAAALTDAIASLLDDPERRAELGRRARSRARSFTWAAGAQRIAAAYARVVGVDEPLTLSELPRTHAP
jgi:glycosyltransferase involved in cell wall biosynthesis